MGRGSTTSPSILFGAPLLVFLESDGATEVHGIGHLERSYELDEKMRDTD